MSCGDPQELAGTSSAVSGTGQLLSSPHRGHRCSTPPPPKTCAPTDMFMCHAMEHKLFVSIPKGKQIKWKTQKLQLAIGYFGFMALHMIYLLVQTVKAYLTAYAREPSFTIYYPKYLAMLFKAKTNSFQCFASLKISVLNTHHFWESLLQELLHKLLNCEYVAIMVVLHISKVVLFSNGVLSLILLSQKAKVTR